VNAAIQEKLAEAKRRPSPSVARALRLEARLSQQLVAEAIGVHRVTLARFELGRQRLRPQATRRLAELLDEIKEAVS
jgi:transcriptional regulator with XRE-family HTH domain